MNHQSHLKKLLKLVMIEPPSDETQPYERGFISGRIPNEFLTEEKVKREETSLILVGEENSLFKESLKILRQDIKTEYLKDNELKNLLWDFICEIFIKKEVYKNNNELIKKIDSFLSEICKPLEIYEVIFRIKNLDIKRRKKILDCFIFSSKKETLRRKGFKYFEQIKKFQEQTLLLVTEKGNNSSLVIDRARHKGNEVIKFLQTYLSEWSDMWNEQLLFSLSEDYLIKKKNDFEHTGSGWRRGFNPVEFDYEDGFRKSVDKVNKHSKTIKPLPEKLRNRINRTVIWIGKAVAEEDFDLKIGFLCTALETLLTTKQDARKGEKIAYRTAILRRHFEKTSTDPREILRLYLMRNDVVHGSKIGIASKSEYHSLLRICNETLDYYIRLISKKNLNKQMQIINLLETSKYVNELYKWLKMFPDKNSKDVLQSLEDDLFTVKS